MLILTTFNFKNSFPYPRKHEPQLIIEVKQKLKSAIAGSACEFVHVEQNYRRDNQLCDVQLTEWLNVRHGT